MKEKVINFLSSFGVISLGAILLFLGSVSVDIKNSKFFWIRFPISGARANNAGGDIAVLPLPESKPKVPLLKERIDYGGQLGAAAFVMDLDTKAVLFKKNSDQARPLASITKLMSAIVLLDFNFNRASTTVIMAEDDDGSDHHVIVGEEYALDDLWRIGLIGSSNIAINALVRAVGLSKEEFAALMNQKARDLRLASLHFAEPTGLSSENVGNALDAARLLREALRFDAIYNTMQTSEHYAHPLNKEKPRRVWSTNWLLTKWIPNNFKSENIIGKTGYTSDAGYNFVVSLADDRKHPIVVVVLGATSTEERFTEARDLASWVFEKYAWPEDAGYEKLTE